MIYRRIILTTLLCAAALTVRAQAQVPAGDTRQEASASYKIAFLQGKYDIRTDYRDNFEQIHRMRTNLSEAMTSPGFTLDSVIVIAHASPEGSWASNTALSWNRGQAVAGLVRDYLAYSDNPAARGVRFAVRNVPENWAGLDRLVTNDPRLSETARAAYFSHAWEADKDARENAMRRDQSYSYIRESLYPLLRYVELSFRGHGTAAPRLDRSDTVYIDRPVVKEVVKEVVREVPVKEYVPVPTPVEPKADDRYHWAVSTNLAKWAFLGTANLGLHFPLAKSWSAELQGRYNPWTYHNDSDSKRMTWRERTLAAGARGWLNGCFEAGPYIGLGAQYTQFNRGGVFGDKTYEGVAYGAYLKAGWLARITDHWKFEAGLGVIGAWADYDVYKCSVCGRQLDSRERWILFPDELNLSIVYVF